MLTIKALKVSFLGALPYDLFLFSLNFVSRSSFGLLHENRRLVPVVNRVRVNGRSIERKNFLLTRLRLQLYQRDRTLLRFKCWLCGPSLVTYSLLTKVTEDV